MQNKIVPFGMADAGLIRDVQLLGHRETAQILAEAAAHFTIRSWLDQRIRYGLSRLAQYEDGPGAS